MKYVPIFCLLFSPISNTTQQNVHSINSPRFQYQAAFDVSNFCLFVHQLFTAIFPSEGTTAKNFLLNGFLVTLIVNNLFLIDFNICYRKVLRIMP